MQDLKYFCNTVLVDHRNIRYACLLPCLPVLSSINAFEETLAFGSHKNKQKLNWKYFSQDFRLYLHQVVWLANLPEVFFQSTSRFISTSPYFSLSFLYICSISFSHTVTIVWLSFFPCSLSSPLLQVCFSVSFDIAYFYLLKNGPIPASFCLFSFISHYNFNTNWKKRRWCAWDSNMGPQDGRRWQNHGAMAATHNYFSLFLLPRL